MLSGTTRAAIGLLDIVEDPVELGLYLREALASVPNRGTSKASVEYAYLDVAMSICYGRMDDSFEDFDAELTLEGIAAQYASLHPRLCLLASYYHLVLRLARCFPADRQGLHLLDGSLLEKLHEQLMQVATRAKELDHNELAGVCASLAAECLWRAGGSIVEVISIASRSNMMFLSMDCATPLTTRAYIRQRANNAMLACTSSLPPPAPDFMELFYRQGELLAA